MIDSWSCTHVSQVGFLPRTCPDPWSYGVKFPASVSSEAYAKLRGKLYKGSSALGVTLASVKQSQAMIVTRFGQLEKRVDRMAARLTKHLGAGRLTAREIASVHLEVIFGWVPLLTDIHAATTSVIQLAEPKMWVKASASSTDYKYMERVVQGHLHRSRLDVEFLEKRATAVSVSNPNRWLAERAGLLNPASIAWDLVPWSFVVNMFVNTAQLVGSLTDFAGLSFTDASTTQFTRAKFAETYTPTVTAGSIKGSAVWSGRYVEHNRSGGATARPPVTWKLPELSFANCALAASLFSQKFSSKIARVVKGNHRLTYTD